MYILYIYNTTQTCIEHTYTYTDKKNIVSDLHPYFNARTIYAKFKKGRVY